MNRNKPAETDGRDRRGRFTKGAPAGPGRSAGTGEHRSAVLRACGPQQVEEIIKAMVERAIEGDTTAARIVLDRVLGRPAEQQNELRAILPSLEDPSDIAVAVRGIVRACAAGEITVEDGRKWIELLAGALEAGEVRDMIRQQDSTPWDRG